MDMRAPEYDLCVIGGGINGAGIARDAAGRGLSVILLEAGDLAGATSSASTKLIHGGLRYLEYHEFGLVRSSLKEREVLWHLAPHLIRPLDFVLPHEETQRPAWLIKAGLFLYDHLGGRKKLHKSYGVNFKTHPFGGPLKKDFKKGFCYSDCWVDDARLVVINAMDAQERGAKIKIRTTAMYLKCVGAQWFIGTRDEKGEEGEITAAKVVNATGPWVRHLLEVSGLDLQHVPKIRLVKGSHIVVPRVYEGKQAYILQQPDKRIVFVIPYEENYTLIGTTEEDYEGNPADAQITDPEMEYLCAAFNRFFQNSVSKSDVVWTYSGVRPLFDEEGKNPTETTRDYKIYEHKECPAPLISIFGGKLTTYRVLAEKVVNKLCGIKGWTADASLPGGNFVKENFGDFLKEKAAQYPFLPSDLVLRYARSYGTRMERFLGQSENISDLGKHYGDNVYEAEIAYLVREEWARSIADILWRRSKLGLHISDQTIQNLNRDLPSVLEKVLPHER